MFFKKQAVDINAPIVWTGDLNDDCTAIWNGLVLRAEWMNKKIWWWAVSPDNNNPLDQIDSSNNYNVKCAGGKMARELAEAAARKFIAGLIA